MGRLIVGILLLVVGVYVVWTAWHMSKHRESVRKYGGLLAVAVIVEVVLLIVLGRIGT